MEYLITFLEGVISFLSPCMLPLLPVYISFFAGDSGGRRKTWLRSAAFVVGFTLVFCLFGVFAGAVGSLLSARRRLVNVVCGLIVVLFGLSYLEIIPLTFLKGIRRQVRVDGVLSAFLFGLVYSVSLTPCVGAFLGSAIMLASSSGSAARGLLLLLVYSMGLGIPFLLSAVLIDGLKAAFNAIKEHYRVINVVCGIFLILVGICMMTGLMGRIMAVS